MIGLHLRKRAVLRDIIGAAAEHNKGRRLRGRLIDARKNLILPLATNTLVEPYTWTQSAIYKYLHKLPHRAHWRVSN
jgi:hypothetical protein